MYIGGSVALIAIGAILRYAVADSIPGINLPVIGLILMIVGAVGLVVTLVQTAMLRDGMRGRGRVVDTPGRTTYYDS
jgi:hypothetical protein